MEHAHVVRQGDDLCGEAISALPRLNGLWIGQIVLTREGVFAQDDAREGWCAHDRAIRLPKPFGDVLDSAVEVRSRQCDHGIYAVRIFEQRASGARQRQHRRRYGRKAATSSHEYLPSRIQLQPSALTSAPGSESGHLSHTSPMP